MRQRIVTIAILLALIGVVISTKLVLKGSPVERSKFWRQAGEVHPSTPMRLVVALKERNMNIVEERLSKTSDPTSSEYGKHMSWEELTSLTGATDEQINTVSTWLKSHGIEHEVTPSRSFIRIRTTVSRAEKMLNCNLRMFETLTSPTKKIIRCIDSYFVPEEIDQLIDFVGPVHGFPHPRTKSRGGKSVPSGTELVVTPELIRKLYNVTVGQTDMQVNNTQAVFVTDDNLWTTDLALFFKLYAPALQNQSIVKYLGNVVTVPNGPALGEATLDVELIMSVGSYAPTYYYAYDGSQDMIPLFLDYAIDLGNDPKPPLVHSISYGDYGGDYPIDQVLRVSNEWMKLGTRGITMLASSGDDGVGCNHAQTKFLFPYPSSPYITLVGGTMVYQGKSNTMYEVAWGNVTGESSSSSGGFSGDFPIPSWQADHVAAYLQQPNLPPKSFYNATGRGIPDLSAPADNVMAVLGGNPDIVGGTSCSAPIVAGLLSQINGVRLKAGKTSVGFINPAIYKLSTINPNAFYDVTQGSNPLYGCPGFPATVGWDAVTGLGTPNFRELLKFFSQLP